MKPKLRTWLPFGLVALLVVALDQFTKGIVEQSLPIGSSFAPIPALAPYFKFTHLTNTGAAFGLLQGQSGLLIVVVTVVVVAVLVYARYLPANNWPVRLALSLQLGGAVGNQIDRLQLGHVTDFLLFTVPVGDRILAWPAFNVADASVVVGVMILALVLLRADGEEQSAVAEATPPAVDNS